MLFLLQSYPAPHKPASPCSAPGHVPCSHGWAGRAEPWSEGGGKQNISLRFDFHGRSVFKNCFFCFSFSNTSENVEVQIQRIWWGSDWVAYFLLKPAQKSRFLVKILWFFGTQKRRGRTSLKTKTFQLSVTENQKSCHWIFCGESNSF